MRQKNLKNLRPLVEDLRVDMLNMAKDMRKIAIILKSQARTKASWRLFLHAYTLEEYVEKLK